MITVKDWMSKPVTMIKPEKTVFEACEKMNKNNIGSIIISSDGKKVDGILTERDVLRKIIGDNVDPKATKVEDVMTKKVVTVDISASLLEISKIMTKNLMRRIVVLENGKVSGIVTSRDLLQLMAG